MHYLIIAVLAFALSTLGCEGKTGPAGPTGSGGAAGPAGPQGSTGPAGPQGSTGPAGPQGADGADGADGATGATGPAGADGKDGAPGAPGEQGPKGDPGETGPQGPQGIAGTPGEKGDKGDPGDPADLDTDLIKLSNILVKEKGKKTDLAGESIYLFEEATVPLVATAVAGNGDTLNVDLVWSTDADHFADVDQTGMVTAVAKGSAKIMVENEATGTASTVTVMVQKAVKSVVLDTDDPTTVEIGGTIMVSAQALDDDEDAVEGQTYTWGPANSDQVTVKPDEDDSSMATVTAKAAGKAKVYAMAGTVKSKMMIEVTVRQGVIAPERRLVVDTGNAPFSRYYYAEEEDVDLPLTVGTGDAATDYTIEVAKIDARLSKTADHKLSDRIMLVVYEELKDFTPDTGADTVPDGYVQLVAETDGTLSGFKVRDDDGEVIETLLFGDLDVAVGEVAVFSLEADPIEISVTVQSSGPGDVEGQKKWTNVGNGIPVGVESSSDVFEVEELFTKTVGEGDSARSGIAMLTVNAADVDADALPASPRLTFSEEYSEDQRVDVEIEVGGN